jgi:uncharacterized membrane protein
MKKTIKKFKYLIVLSVMVTGIIGLAQPVVPAVHAQTPEQTLCQGSGGTFSNNTCSTSGDTHTVAGTIRSVVTLLTFIVGAISVLMAVIAGIRYVVSAGDSKAVTDAKNTLLYAIVGLVVASSAYAIVNFVLIRLKYKIENSNNLLYY